MVRCLTALGAVLTAGLAAPSGAFALGAENFDVHATITTDYVFRGITQTRGNPAIQAGFDFRHPSGFFAGIWGSNVDFPSNRGRDEPRTLELDLFVGFEVGLGRGWSGTATLLRYGYPGAGSEFDYSYNELNLSLVFRERVEVVVAYTDDTFGTGSPSRQYQLLGGWPMPWKLNLVAGLGHADYGELFIASYTYWNLGISRSLDRFTFDLGWFDTSSESRAFWGELAEGRLVLSVSASIR